MGRKAYLLASAALPGCLALPAVPSPSAQHCAFASIDIPSEKLLSEPAGANWSRRKSLASTHLFYFLASENCSICLRGSDKFIPVHTFYATGAKRSPGDAGRKTLLAYDLFDSQPKWKYPQVGSGRSSAGTTTTAGGLVFFGDDAESFEAVNASTGAPLWHFNTGQSITASPVSFSVNGNQHVAIAAGSDIFCFRL
jgi:alcohol dehydrogenase (cytochrome c)